MDFEYPLILVAKKEFLECFQHGDLYMVSCLHYQEMENEDTKRGDKYDGAIKCSCNKYEVRSVINPRLMLLTTYVKCFYHFKGDNVEVLENNTYRFSLSKESFNELATFNEEYALIIYDVRKFIERFSYACEHNKNISNYFYSDVIYINDEDYPKYEKDLVNGALGKKTEGVTNPAFIKRKKYSPQQEFRIAVLLDMGEQPVNATGVNIPESIDFSTDSIEDISVIVKLKDIADKSLLAKIISSDGKKGVKIEYYL